MKLLRYTSLQPRPIKRKGKTIQPQIDHDRYHADVLPGKLIRIWGTLVFRGFGTDVTENTFDLTFKIGDVAIYDSYNLIYTGKITTISAKTVTIIDESHRLHRLDLYTFCRRDCKFNLEEIEKRNARTMQEI